MALAGEEVIIANRDKPVVKLVAIETVEKPKRKIGTGKHLGILIGDDFDDPIDYLFEGYYPEETNSPKVAEDKPKYNGEEI